MAGIKIFLLLPILSLLCHLTSQTTLEDITKLVKEKHHNEVYKSPKHSKGNLEEIGKFQQSVIGSTVRTYKFAG